MSTFITIEGPQHAPPVLLAHGILATHRMWDGLASELTSHWRVIRYDVRGHGGTPATPQPYTMDALAADAVAVLDLLGIARAHFIGTSLGGMIGQVLGADHGERLLSLTLANTTAVQATPQAWEDRMAVALDKGVAPLVEPTLQRWFTPACFARDPAFIDVVRGEALRTSVEGFVGCAAAVRDLQQLTLLPRITVRTLVVAGADDAATPPADARALQEAIAGARLVTLPAAHQAAAEFPRLFAEAWTAFQRQAD